MTSVIAFGSLLQDTTLDDTQKLYVDMIESSGEALLSLVNDVLDISKIEAGQLEFSLDTLSPSELAHEAVGVMHLRLNPTRVEVKAEMSSRMPDFVISDRSRSRQILLNLPGNAVKFTSDGLIAMMVDYSTEGELIFKVKDRGTGIAAADQERLFIPLSQVDTSPSEKYGRTGLGLSICRRLREALEGDISLHSVMGEGPCFTVRIPAERATIPSLETEGIETNPQSLDTSLRLLLVEDSGVNREIAGMIFKSLGFQNMLTAEGGMMAMEVLGENHVDIVFIDVEMPGWDGMETASRIRTKNTDRLSPLWIVGLSANVMPETKLRACERWDG